MTGCCARRRVKVVIELCEIFDGPGKIGMTMNSGSLLSGVLQFNEDVDEVIS